MDYRKFTPAIKAALSVIVVTFIYKLIPGYFPSWKECGVAAVLTVTGVLDHTIGATLNKCTNNIGASIIGGCIGYGAFLIGDQLGSTGQIPFLASLVIIVLMYGLTLKYTNVVSDQYDSGLSGLATAVATASLSTMSARGLMIQLIRTKLMGLAIGVSVCLTVSIFVPVFASGLVHKSMIEYLDKLATFYEGLEEICSDKGELENIEGKEFLKLPREVLDDKGKYESMLTHVTYEPHGRLFWFPLDLYTKLGDICQNLAEFCCPLSSNLINLSKEEALALKWKQNSVIRKAYLEMSSQSAKSLRSLSKTIKTKTKPLVSIKETLLSTLNAASEIENAQFSGSQNLIDSVKVVEKLAGAVDELAQIAGYREPVKPDPVHEEISGEEKKEQGDHVAIDIDSLPVGSPGPINHVVLVVPSQCERGEKDMKGDHMVIDMSKLEQNMEGGQMVIDMGNLDPVPSATPSKPRPMIKKLLSRLFSRFQRELAKTHPLYLTSPLERTH